MQHAVKTLDNSVHVPMSARALSRVDSNRHHGTARPQESRDTATGQNNRRWTQNAVKTPVENAHVPSPPVALETLYATRREDAG
ncbi:hypothetical protein NDU88_006420 [Pleurodeles waltl]|uniref:Uncharacterized protein n=1 Tax=Pleurodeles waltl TaxID=8319 RepID=A0AAV7X0M2_PLEWA|nr:hypothetical protein NDU88_006420 [Pleurodeles waltl]